MVGATAATLVAIPILLKRPLVGEAGDLGGYFRGSPTWHVLGLLAGAVWCSGTVFNFISAGMVGVAISVGIGSGAPMVGALWGVFVWDEFAKGPASSRTFIGAALVLYAVGIATMAIAQHVLSEALSHAVRDRGAGGAALVSRTRLRLRRALPCQRPRRVAALTARGSRRDADLREPASAARSAGGVGRRCHLLPQPRGAHGGVGRGAAHVLRPRLPRPTGRSFSSRPRRSGSSATAAPVRIRADAHVERARARAGAGRSRRAASSATRSATT